MRRIAMVGAEIEQDELKERAAGYELWSVNNLFEKWPDVKFDRWFEIHDIKLHPDGFYLRRSIPWYPIGRKDRTVKDYLEDLNRLGCTVYMQQEWPGIVKRSLAFPAQKYRALWGDYWGCSFAWMTAMAIDEAMGPSRLVALKPLSVSDRKILSESNFEFMSQGSNIRLLDSDVAVVPPEDRVVEIAYFGCKLDGHEYYYQRASTERMIGVAEGMGIKITIDETSSLLKSNYIYAFGERFDLIYMLHGAMAKDLAMTMMTAAQEALERWAYGGSELRLVEEPGDDRESTDPVQDDPAD